MTTEFKDWKSKDGKWSCSFTLQGGITGNCGISGVQGSVWKYDGGSPWGKPATVEEVVELIENDSSFISTMRRPIIGADGSAMLLLSARLAPGPSLSVTLIKAFMQQKHYPVVVLPPTGNTAHTSLDSIIQMIAVFMDRTAMEPTVLKQQKIEATTGKAAKALFKYARTRGELDGWDKWNSN